jgi:hypothetical protein
VPVLSHRSMTVAELRSHAVGRFSRIVIARNAAEALRLARAATSADGITLVAGSDYLVGELMRDAHGSHDEPDLSDPGRGAPPAAAPTPRRPARRRRK